LLDLLAGQPEPTTITALVSATGLHANTVREHLDALLDAGLVRREKSPPRGRGRPSWLYTAVEPPEPGSDAAEYADLAAALARHIARTSPDPRADALAIGADWGRDLARRSWPDATAPSSPSSPVAARRRVIGLLERLHFDPDPDQRTEVIRLRRCPLLTAAHQERDVVCNVHLGIVRGVLEELGADSSHTELVPFAEPGACRLEFATDAPAPAADAD
jgi:predicted ArsR family transcriptional regulator